MTTRRSILVPIRPPFLARAGRRICKRRRSARGGACPAYASSGSWPLCGRRCSSGARVLLQELDRIAHGLDALGRVVGNLAAELLLEGHHQLNGVQAVSAQVVNEAGA